MKISLEAECLPLFAAGAVLVVLAELILALRSRPADRGPLIGHIACTAAAFFCLGWMLFVPRTTPDGDVYDSSMLLASFGIFWFAAECCLLWALGKRK